MTTSESLPRDEILAVIRALEAYEAEILRQDYTFWWPVRIPNDLIAMLPGPRRHWKRLRIKPPFPLLRSNAKDEMLVQIRTVIAYLEGLVAIPKGRSATGDHPDWRVLDGGKTRS